MIDRRTFLRSIACPAAVGGIAIMATPSAASFLSHLVEIDPIFAEIEKHRAAYAAFDTATKEATDEYLDSPEYDAIDEAEREARRSLVETSVTTLQGLAAFSAYILHQPDTRHDWPSLKAALETIAVASAKFAYLEGETGR